MAALLHIVWWGEGAEVLRKKALAVTASCHLRRRRRRRLRRDVVALFAFYELPFGTLEACHAAYER